MANHTMPPLQMGKPFKRKDIANAFFNFDISDSGPPTASQTPKPRDRNNQVALLTLPIEIRLRIYDLLLVSRFDRTENSSWAVGHTDQKLVLLSMGQFRQYRTMEPGILQTCKQINREATSILYSQNVFAISEPGQMFQLIMQIGLVNLKLIKTLHIWVPWMAELSPWLQLLDKLAEEASGLRCVEITWNVDCDLRWLPRGARERGLGDNLDFVRALAKIQLLEEVVIAGYYAKNWPAYLEERMGVRVRAICGSSREECESKERDLHDDELELMIREMKEDELQTFMQYQEGTDDLIP